MLPIVHHSDGADSGYLHDITKPCWYCPKPDLLPDKFPNSPAPEYGKLLHLDADTPPYKLHGPCLRSEEHTSELQSRENLVCRLLLEKKKLYRGSQFYSII